MVPCQPSSPQQVWIPCAGAALRSMSAHTSILSCKQLKHLPPTTPMPCLWPLTHCRLETDQGILLRFVIGHAAQKEQEGALEQEAAAYGGFMRLDIQVLRMH